MIVYYTEWNTNSGKAPDKEILLRKALTEYDREKSLGLGAERINGATEVRNEHGKPSFPELEGLQFSVTHTEGLWACAAAELPVGLDAERTDRRISRYQDIAKRWFTEEEREYLKEKDSLDFIRVWIRKEAYVKYLGTGIAAQGLQSFSVIHEGRQAESPGDGVFFREFLLGEHGVAVCCGTCPEDPERIVKWSD